MPGKNSLLRQANSSIIKTYDRQNTTHVRTASYAGKNKKKRHKNAPDFNTAVLSKDYFGIDLLKIEGVKTNTVMTFISEVGSDIYKFPTKKNFTWWLRLAPNNKKTG